MQAPETGITTNKHGQRVTRPRVARAREGREGTEPRCSSFVLLSAFL